MSNFRITLFAICVITLLTGANKKLVMNDSSIVEIIKVANLSELDLARLAKNRSENQMIETFATKVIKDHSSDLSKIYLLVKKKRLSFVENKLSKDIEMRGMARFDQLQVLKGKSFDKAYIDTMVAIYTSTQQQLESLIPVTLDADLENLLIQTRGHITAHLSEAQKIQETFGN